MSLIPAKLIDPCGEASVAITEGQERFTRKSQVLVAKTLVDLRNDFVPLRLFNPTDQPKTVYQNSITAWCETVEEVTEGSRPEVQNRVVFLGHAVSKDGVSTDPEKKRAVYDWPTPASASALRSFLGLCSYYRPFELAFANIASPLRRPKKKNTFSGTCNTGVGAVFSQKQGQEMKVIAYFSRRLTKAERRYCVTRKELLALVTAARHFHHYVSGLSNTRELSRVV